jgi:hypothetical protein
MEIECKFKDLDESFEHMTKNDILTLYDVIEQIEKLIALDSIIIDNVGIEIPRRDGHSGEHVFVITKDFMPLHFTAEYRGVQKYN